MRTHQFRIVSKPQKVLVSAYSVFSAFFFSHSPSPPATPSRLCSPRSLSREKPQDSEDYAYLKAALEKITRTLDAIITRVERVEEELIKQQRLIHTPSSSNDVTPRRSKVHVPLIVRVSRSIPINLSHSSSRPSHCHHILLLVILDTSSFPFAHVLPCWYSE